MHNRLHVGAYEISNPEGIHLVNSEVLPECVLRRSGMDMALQDVQVPLYRMDDIVGDRGLVL